MNITKQKYIHRYIQQSSGYQRGEWGGTHRGKGLRGTRMMYKISYKDIFYNKQDIADIL